MPYFPAKRSSRDPRQRDMLANFWTAPTAWFQDGTGPNSEDLPCPSVTSFCCSAEGFYLTVFDHQTPIGNHSQGPRRQTTIFSAILHVVLDRADDARTLLHIWLTFYSMDLRKLV